MKIGGQCNRRVAGSNPARGVLRQAQYFFVLGLSKYPERSRRMLSMAERWYVYIIECSDKSLYTGVTSDIKRRLKEHNSGKGGKYTRERTPTTLVYSESYRTKSEALKREIQIKGWTKSKKKALTEHDNATLKRLSRSR